MMRAQLRRLARIILIFLRSAIPYFSMSYRLTLSLCLLLTGQQGLAAPYIPRADEVVLERLPVKPNDPAMREIRELRGALVRDPQNRERAIRLARRYFEQAMAQGDPRYVGYAQAALKPWWDLPEPPTPILVMRASLMQYRHDFSSALADLARALERDPTDARAWSLRAAC